MSSYKGRNWIGGRHVSASRLTTSIDPATYQPIGDYPDDGAKAAAASIVAARTAFARSAWRHDAELRARVLFQMADAVERNLDRLISVLSLENGKIRGEASFEVAAVPGKLRYWASMALTDSGRAITPRHEQAARDRHRQRLRLCGSLAFRDRGWVLRAALAPAVHLRERCEPRPPGGDGFRRVLHGQRGSADG